MNMDEDAGQEQQQEQKLHTLPVLDATTMEVTILKVLKSIEANYTLTPANVLGAMHAIINRTNTAGKGN